MTRRLLDYDPVRGLSCYYEYKDGTQEVILTHEQDVSLMLDANKRDAADHDKTANGIKNDWWKYASIPAIVEIEWLQKFGVNLHDPAHKKKVFQLLNSPDYKYLKTTDKIHTINAG